MVCYMFLSFCCMPGTFAQSKELRVQESQLSTSSRQQQSPYLGNCFRKVHLHAKLDICKIIPSLFLLGFSTHTHTHNKDGRLEIVVVTAYANFEGLYVKFCEHVIFMALKLLWLTSILICSGFSRTLPP